MFLVEAFKVYQRQPVFPRLINVDMRPERGFAELCSADIIQYLLTLQHILISQVKRRSHGNGVAHFDITNKGPAHANLVVISRILI